MALCTVLLLVAFVASAELHTPVVIDTETWLLFKSPIL